MDNLPTTRFPVLFAEERTASKFVEASFTTNVSRKALESTPTVLNSGQEFRDQVFAAIGNAWADVLRRFLFQDQISFVVVNAENIDVTTAQVYIYTIPNENPEIIPSPDLVSLGINLNTALFWGKNGSEECERVNELLSSTKPESAKKSFLTASIDVDGSAAKCVSVTFRFSDNLMTVDYAQSLFELFDRALLKQMKLPPSGVSTTVLASSIANPTPKHFMDESRFLLHHLFENSAATYPSRTALSFLHAGASSAHNFTYSELDDRANKLARYIVAKVGAITPDTIIPVYLPQSPEFYIAVLAVLKAGGAFLPVAEDAPHDRVSYIFSDSSARVVITKQSLKAAYDAYADGLKLMDENHTIPDVTIIAVDACEKEIANLDGSGIDHPHTATSHLAYVQYTSGSTGRPKGTLIEHGSAVDSILAHQPFLSWNDSDKFLQFASITFDVSIFEIFFPWSVGMTLCGATRDLLLTDLTDVINTFEITHMELTPTVAAMVDPPAVPSVKTLLTIGEMMTQQVVKSWATVGKLQPAYGPTETAIHVSLMGHFPATTKPSNIGTPLESCSWFVMPIDESGDHVHPVPVGCIGELCIGGFNVGRGYLNRPEETAKAFVNFAGQGASYRTGDLARMLPDGSLDILGRINDEQVKLNGQRMELAEVTAIIGESLIGVSTEFVSVVIKDDPEKLIKNDALVAFVVIDVESVTGLHAQTVSIPSGVEGVFYTGPYVDQLEDNCRRHAQSKLPSYMVPKHIIIIREFPRLPSSKLDRKSLSALFKLFISTSAATTDSSDLDVARWSEPERVVFDQIRTLFGFSLQLGESLRNAGIDSFGAIQLSSALRKCGYRVQVLEIMKQGSSIRSVGNSLQADQPTDSTSNARELDPEQGDVRTQLLQRRSVFGESIVEDAYPCTPLQEGMLMESMGGSGINVHHIDVDLIANVDIASLLTAFATVVERNPILRTNFVYVEPSETARPGVRVPVFWQVVYKRSLAVELRECKTEAEFAKTIKEIHCSVDNEDSMDTFDRPVKVYLVKQADAARLILMIHHAVYDIWTMNLLFAELRKLYWSESQNLLIQRPSFRSFVDHISAVVEEEVVEFWKARFENFSGPFIFSQLNPNLSYTKPADATVIERDLSVDPELLDEASRRFDTTLVVMFQAAWALVLSGALSTPDVVFGTVRSGRTTLLDGVENVVGPCFNTIPFRASWSDKDTVADFLNRVQDFHLATMKFEQTPLKDIQKLTGKASRSLFDTIFLYQKFLEEEVEPGRELWTAIKDDSKDVNNLAIVIEVLPNGKSFLFRGAFDARRIPAEVAGALLDNMNKFLSLLSSSSSLHVMGELVAEQGVNQVHLRIAEAAVPVRPSNDVPESSWNSEEKLLRTVIAKIRNIDESTINKGSSIYRLGLDSIHVIQLSSKLKGDHGILLSFREIMENPSIVAMAKYAIERGEKQKSSQARSWQDSFSGFAEANIPVISERLGVSQSEVSSIYPCTPTQSAMVAQTQISPNSYFNTFAYQLSDDIDLEKLKRAWGKLFEIHDVLRTRFVPVDDVKHPFAQVVISKVDSIEWKQYTATSTDEVRSVLVRHHEESIAGLSSMMNGVASFGVMQTPNDRILFLTINHAVYDGWSLELMLNDVATIYEGGVIPTFNQFGEAVDCILISQADEEVRGNESFWRTYMAGANYIPFPDVSGNVETPTGRHFAQIKFAMPLDSVDTACKTLGTTLANIGQAAWARVLAEYLNSEDVTFGTVYTGRTIDSNIDLNNVRGPCLTTIPCRARVGERVRNRDIVASIHADGIQRMAFQLTPLRSIRRWTGVSEEASALFDTIFLYQFRQIDDKEERKDHSSLWTELEGVFDVEYSVAIEFERTPSGDLLLGMSAKRSIMSVDHCNILLQQISSVLKDILLHPDNSTKSTASIPINLLGGLNINVPDMEGPSGFDFMYSGVEINASKMPDAPALLFTAEIGHDGSMDPTLWNYAQLNENANRIANYLLKAGIQPEDRIPVCMARSPYQYAAILGISKAGGVYVPIEPEYPVARKLLVVKDTTARAIMISSDDSSEWVPEGVLVVDPRSDLIAKEGGENPTNVQITPQNLAYILYTSGTTGMPKGVMVSHHSINQALLAFTSFGSFTPSSRFLQFASCTFDVSLGEMFGTWYAGSCLCTAPLRVLLQFLPIVINAMGITHMAMTATVAKLIPRMYIPGVRHLICGGELMSHEVLEQWGDGHSLLNAYGPSETTIGCTIFAGMSKKDKVGNIGVPFPNTPICVVAPNGEPSLIGCPGELFIGGPLVSSRGYLNRAELTEKAFVMWSPKPDEVALSRWYKSGDLARVLANGQIEHLGRRDEQIKIRGMRVELNEISTVIRGSDSRIEATTTLMHESEAGKQLLSFIQISSLARADHPSLIIGESDEIRAVLESAFRTARSKLPVHMVPTFILPVKAFPLGPTGKLDKRALVAAFLEHRTAYTQQQAEVSMEDTSWTETEEMIRDIVCSVGKVSPTVVKRNSSLFELGIDSINITHVAGKLRQKGIMLSIAEVMTFQTLKDLAWRLDQLRAESSPSAEPVDSRISGIKERFAEVDAQVKGRFGNMDILEAYPCTPLQAGILFESMKEDGATYANVFRLRLASHTEVDRLKQAWSAVVDKHEILRTIFVALDDSEYGFAQVVLKPGSLNWEINSSAAERKIDESFTLQSPLKFRVASDKGVTYLVISIHHALYDGWSLTLVFNDVVKSYRGQKLLSAPRFKDMVEVVHSMDLESAAGYWKTRLDAVVPSFFPNLTTESSLVSHADRNRLQVRTVISSIAVAEVENFTKRARVTSQAVYQGMWAKVLSSFIGSEDVVFGNVISGRLVSLEGADSIVGPCFNTIPVRAAMAETNEDLVRALHLWNVESLRFQHTPLGTVAKLAGLDSGSSLFNTLFLNQREFSSESDTSENLWELDGGAKGILNFPVCIEVLERANGQIELLFAADEAYVPAELMPAMLSHVDVCLKEIIHHPTSSCASLDLGSYSKNPELFSVRNTFPPTVDSPQLLHQFFESTANVSGHMIALEWVDNLATASSLRKVLLTFSELNEKANQVANYLLKQLPETSESVEHIIPIHMEKSIELYITILGILKAGCAYFPVDPALPIHRKTQMINQINPSIIFTSQDIHSELAEAFGEIVLTSVVEKASNESTTAPVADINASKLAYVIATSGTTGTPKLVMIEHRNVVQSVASFANETGVFEHVEKLPQLANFAFDVSVYEMWITWMKGGCLVCAKRDEFLSDIETAVCTLGITHICLPPALATLVKRERMPTIRAMLCGGEALTAAVLEQWAGSSETVLLNCYGPTETSVNALVKTGIPKSSKPTDIGREQSTCSIYVLSPQLQPVLLGAIGELCIGGPQVSRGYLNQPELTSEKFIDYAVENGLPERIYRTGDLVRMLYNGSVEYLGRIDTQVKKNGLRIELAEISNALLRGHPSVIDAATLMLSHPTLGQQQLVSFIVIEAGDARKTPEVVVSAGAKTVLNLAIESATRSLPPYMIPNSGVVLTHLPIGRTGKVDIALLNSIYLDAWNTGLIQNVGASDNAMGEELTLTSTTAKIIEVLEKMTQLPAEQIVSAGSFFILGLDSLSMIRLCSMLRNAGVEVTISEVLRNPSVSRLSKYIGSKSGKKLDEVPLPIDLKAFEDSARSAYAQVFGEDLSKGIQSAYPCTPLQEGMISKCNTTDGAYYINTSVFALAPGADRSRLISAWRTVIERNEVLRTSFIPIASHFAQIVHSEAFVEVVEIKIPHGLESDVHLRKASEQAVRKVMSEPQRPPIRFTVLDGVDSSAWLLCTLHHALYDGFSIRLLLDQVQKVYFDETLSDTSDVRFVEFVEHILRTTPGYLDEASAESGDRTYWTSILKDSKGASFPVLDQTRSLETQSAFALDSHTISLERLQRLCEDLECSMQAVFEAAWAILLQSYTGSKDVSFGQVVSGRTCPVPGVEELVAPTFNTVVVRIPDVTNFTSVSELVRFIQQQNTNSLDYQFTPLRAIKRWLGQDDEKASRQLFDTLFLFQKMTAATDSGKSLAADIWSLQDGHDAVAEYAVNIEIEPNESSVVIRGASRAELMSLAQLKLIIEQLEAIVAGIADEPTKAVGWPSLSRSQLSVENSAPSTYTKEELLKRWEVRPAQSRTPTVSKQRRWSFMNWVSKATLKSGSTEMPRDFLLHFAFEQHARATPNSTALEFTADEKSPKETFTYAALNANANKLAHLLSSLDVRPNELIPVCFDRCPNAYISILAVLKAGCGYVPIDPAWPSERKKLIFEDVGARVIICSSSIARTLPSSSKVTFVVPDAAEWKSKLNSMMSDDIGPIVTLTGNSIAYVIFTSGSTGTPKGCLIDHHAASQTIAAFSDALPFDASGRYLQFAAFAFDVSVLEMFLPWSRGGATVTTPKEELLRDLEGFVRKNEVTHLGLTPTASAALLNNPDRVPSVKALVSGGEKMTQAVVSAWAASGKLFNAYGPTEATIGVSIGRFGLDDVFGMVGKPFKTVSAFVVDTNLNVLPRGVVGELVLGGPQLGKYLNRPDQTAQRFVKLPYTGEVVYRTGDLARLLVDGSIVILGREDDQVKLNGQRLELEEISTVSRMVAGVVDAVSMVCTHPTLVRDQLVVFVVCGSQQSETGDKINIEFAKVHAAASSAVLDQCQEKLPPYMVPSFVISLPSLPRGLTNKVDSNAMRKLFESADSELLDQLRLVSEGSEEHSAIESSRAWQDVESVVRDIIAKISGVQTNAIRLQSTLGQLGIDSISVVQVASELKRAGLGVSIAQILRGRTLRNTVAAAVELKQSGAVEEMSGLAKRNALQSMVAQRLGSKFMGSIAGRLGVDDDEIEVVLPCAPGQHFTIASWAELHGSRFIGSFIFVLKETPTDGTDETLHSAWTQLVRENPILRTTFVSSGDENDLRVVQVVLKSSSDSSWRSDKGDALEMVWDSMEAKSILRERASQSANFIHAGQLARPPVQIQHIEFSNASVLLLTVHHALYDGWSMTLLPQKFEQALAKDESAYDFEFEQVLYDIHEPNKWESAVAAKQSFWTSALSGANQAAASIFSFGKEQTEERIYHGILMQSGPELQGLNEKLESVSRESGITVESLFMATWAKVQASRHALQNETSGDVLFGMYHAGRQVHLASQNLLAPTFNVVPVYARGALDLPLLELARQLQRSMNEQRHMTQVSLLDIHEWAGKSDRPLFNVHVNLLKYSTAEESLLSSSKFELAPLEDLSSETHSEKSSIGIPALVTANGIERPFLVNGQRSVPAELDLEVGYSSTRGIESVGLFCRKSFGSASDLHKLVSELSEMAMTEI
ncbi:hypothetical protein BJ742DRAFT_77326 [Cladochytrium replicatum]|nr:hypothetical protein BJ742DRAFT_77326 [Cladochytrium replicatum]